MDITEIKNEIREFLIEKLTPQAVTASYETPLSDGVNNFNLAQSFKPFSTCFRPRKGVTSTNIPVSLSLVKYGTPDSGVKISLQASNASALPSGIDIASFKIAPSEVYGSATIVTKNLALTEYLTSKGEYNILITPEFSISSASYISVNRNNVDDKYAFGTVVKAIAGTTSWIAQSWDIYFKFKPSNFIFTDYPRADLNIKCYDEKSEILTENGWKHFKDLNEDEKIMVMNPDTEEIYFEVPKEKYEFNYEGPMISLQNKSLDLKVTPGHRVLVYNGTYKSKYIIPIEKATNTHIPRAGYWKGREVKYYKIPEFTKKNSKSIYVEPELKFKIKPFLKLLGFYLSEGCSFLNSKSSFSITQISKEDVRNEIEDTLLLLKLPYTKSQEGFIVHSSQLWKYFRQFGHSREKFIPKEIKELTPRLLAVLLDALLKGDGYKGEDGIIYWTTSEQLADDLQEIGVKLHMRTVKKQYGNHSDWSIRFSTKKPYSYLRKELFKIEKYKGKVYCVQTNPGIILVRRNGKPVLAGNSYPRLVVDITSRRTEARWISHEVAQYIMTFQLTMYSEYLDELDLVLSKADQALFESRIKWDTFDEYFPGNMTRPSVARQNLISRALISTIKKKQGTGEFDPEGFNSGFNIDGVAAE